MPAWEYVVRQRLKVGADQWLEPGEITTLPNTWHPSALRAHLNTGAIEKGRLLPDVDYDEQRPATYAPEGYDELVPTPDPVVGSRFPAADATVVDCTNCRGDDSGDSTNYVPESAASFQCWHCGQQQTVAAALSYPPQSFEEWQRAGFRQGGR